MTLPAAPAVNLGALAEAARIDLAGFERALADGDMQLARIYAENVSRWMGHACCALDPRPLGYSVEFGPHRQRSSAPQ